MSAPWFRVPAFLPQKPPEVRAAWVYLLGAWHSGDDPGTREIARATGFGVGRVLAFVADARAWAADAGATCPAADGTMRRARVLAAHERECPTGEPETCGRCAEVRR